MLIDYEKIFKIYKESKLKTAMGVGAASVASLIGSPSQSAMEPTTYYSEYSDIQVLNNDVLVDLWARFYQTDNDPEKRERATLVIKNGVDAPEDAMSAIQTAVYIFGGDEGVTPNVLTELLIYTGKIESNYTTKIQKTKNGEGPARGYWQVEPKTAVDLLLNSRAYFGPKFKSVFGDELLRVVKVNDKRTRDYVAEKILNDDNLAASFAAAKWISVSKRANLRNIKNY